MVADRRLCDVAALAEIAGADLAAVRELPQHREARWIRSCLEQPDVHIAGSFHRRHYIGRDRY